MLDYSEKSARSISPPESEYRKQCDRSITKVEN